MSIWSSISLDSVSKTLGAITATFAMIGGGYTLFDRMTSRPVLTWHEEFFSVASGLVDGKFAVVVAREKHRDDCTVEQFRLSIKDSKFHVHPVTASVSVFSGPASHKVDRFGYDFTVPQEHQDLVNKGPAKLLAYIVYKCPEGQVIVNYPDSDKLNFEIK